MTYYGFIILGFGLVIALLLFSPMQDGLPIGAKYPFNTTIPPWHAIALSIEVLAVSGGVVAILSTDSIMVLISNLIIMQFDVLNVNFENCGGPAAKDVRKERAPKCELIKISMYLSIIVDRQSLQRTEHRKRTELYFLESLQGLPPIPSAIDVYDQ